MKMILHLRQELLHEVVGMFPNTILPMPSLLHFVDSMPLLSMHSECSVHPNSVSSHHTPAHVTTETQDTSVNIEPVARPKRNSRAPKYLSEYHCSLVPFITTSNHITSVSQDPVPIFPTPYPISSVLSYDSLSPYFQVYTLAYTLEREPKNFKQAMTSDVWNKSMNVELDALEQN